MGLSQMANKKSTLKQKGGQHGSAPKKRTGRSERYAGKYSDDIKYSPAVAREICHRIADGQSMRTICADAHMPSMQSIFRWVVDHPEFTEQYKAARDMQADAALEDIIRIEDKVELEQISDKAANVSIRSKQWRMERTAPRKYSLTQNLNVGGQHGENPVQAEQKHRLDMDLDGLKRVIEEQKKE